MLLLFIKLINLDDLMFVISKSNITKSISFINRISIASCSLKAIELKLILRLNPEIELIRFFYFIISFSTIKIFNMITYLLLINTTVLIILSHIWKKKLKID